MDSNNAKSNEGQPSSKSPPIGQRGPALWLATGAGVGFVPWAPGTVGAMWGLPIAIGIAHLPSIWMRVLVILVLCIVGVPVCRIAAQQLGKKDPGAVVWDEIASMPMTFFLIPAAEMIDPGTMITGFLLHRLFDITKPPPARQLEQLPDGLGIMADDWAAGVYSCLVLHGLRYWGLLSWFTG